MASLQRTLSNNRGCRVSPTTSLILSLAYLVVLVAVVVVEVLLVRELRQTRREVYDVRTGMRDLLVGLAVLHALSLAINRLAQPDDR